MGKLFPDDQTASVLCTFVKSVGISMVSFTNQFRHRCSFILIAAAADVIARRPPPPLLTMSSQGQSVLVNCYSEFLFETVRAFYGHARFYLGAVNS